MEKIIFIFLSMTLLLSPSYASEKTVAASVNSGIQEATAATLEDDSQGEIEKPKKKKTKKAKKAKKAKKLSN